MTCYRDVARFSDPGPFAPAALGFIGFGDIVDLGERIFGGGGGGAPPHWRDWVAEWAGQGCPGAPPMSAVRSAFTSAPPSVVQAWYAAWAAANPGRTLPSVSEIPHLSDPELSAIVRSAQGGKDCMVTSAAGLQSVPLWDRLMTYAGSTFPAGTPPQGHIPPPDADSVSGLLRRLGSDALERLRAVVGAATTDAAVRLYDSLSPTQRAEIERQIVAQRTAGVGAAALPWIVGIGLGLVVLRRAKVI